MKKITTLEEFSTHPDVRREKKTVLVGGCFDVFHYGHLTFLRNAKKAGEFLIVTLESDQFIRERKKRTPIHNQQERAEILAALEYVDLVIKLPLLKTHKEYFEVVEKIKPSIIGITEGDPLAEKKKEQARLCGGEVQIVTSLLPNFASSRIVQPL